MGCAEWIQYSGLGSGASRLVHKADCTNNLVCQNGDVKRFSKGQTVNVNACPAASSPNPPASSPKPPTSSTNPPASSTKPPASSTKPPASTPKCNEWVQRSPIGSGADRLVHYKTCTKRLYCKDGKTHEFKVGQTPNINACGNDGATSDGCPKVSDGSVFCDYKFSDTSKISGYPVASDSWTSCQRRCWDHGDTCKGWFYKSSTKQCTLSTHRDKSQMKAAKGYMGGPRRDVNAGPIVTSSDGTAPIDTSNNTPQSFIDDSDDYESEGEPGWIQSWIKEHKTGVIIGTLIVILLSLMCSAGFAILMFT